MSQKQRLLELLSDGRPHRTDEICKKVYIIDSTVPTLARVGARIWDLKKEGHNIAGWHDENNPKLYWYQNFTGTS